MRIKDTTTNRQQVIEVICQVLEINENEIMSKGRLRQNVVARQIASKIFRDYFNMTYSEIARYLSRNRRKKMDHSTIMHGFQTANNLVEVEDPTFYGHYMRVVTSLEAIADRLQYVRVFAKGNKLEALESFLNKYGYDYEVPKPMKM